MQMFRAVNIIAVLVQLCQKDRGLGVHRIHNFQIRPDPDRIQQL